MLGLLAVYCYIFSILYTLCLYASDTSVPVGQNPSIVYTPNSNSGSGNVFLIYNSAQGLESMYCEDSKCDSNIKQTLKCDSKLYSSSLISIDTEKSKECTKTVSKENNQKTYQCTYYIVIGYGSLTSKSSTNSVSFIICYDKVCNLDLMDEIIIDTSFDSQSTYSGFGYSTSLTTYVDLSGSNNRYPMFTYSKYSNTLKQFILNVIICLDFYCSTWIGKEQRDFPSNPPYVTLGIKPGGDNSVAKGVVSIQETWSSQTNYVSVMFSKNVNITNTSSLRDVYVLVIGTCGLSSSGLVDECTKFTEKELNSTIIFEKESIEEREKQILSINQISMIRYEPSVEGITGVPLFITSYILHSNELWLLYCFNIFCNSRNRTYYKVSGDDVESIDYPQISIHTKPNHQYMPNIIFFENSTSLMVMSCQYDPNPWNCTDLSYNHPTLSIYKNMNFETTSMQISVIESPSIETQSVILFSQVMDRGDGGGIFNGTMFINCQTEQCKIFYSVMLDNQLNTDKFSTSFDITVFVIMSWILCFITIFGIFCIYKFISPSQFISKNVRNAYLTKVSLDSSRIRPLSYWFFFANLICSAMCIIPWFAYFDYDYKLYSLMIIPPFIPVILTLILVLILHICPLQQNLSPILITISSLYWLSTISLSYSFAFVWNLKSENCQTSDLSGLKIVILVGHIATCLVVEYLLFWNVKCFQALKLASPENIGQSQTFNHLNNNNNNDLNYNINNNTHHKIIPNSRLLAALHDRQRTQ